MRVLFNGKTLRLGGQCAGQYPLCMWKQWRELLQVRCCLRFQTTPRAVSINSASAVSKTGKGQDVIAHKGSCRCGLLDGVLLAGHDFEHG